MTTLEQKHCLPCEGIGAPFDETTVQNKLLALGGEWSKTEDNQVIFKDFRFKNFYQTMAFVNALAWMANLENHHPDLEIGYNHCLVRYTTHAIHGLSINDFICATKVNEIFQPYAEKFYDRK